MWIWQHIQWPSFTWRDGDVLPSLSKARLAQGRSVGQATAIDVGLQRQAQLEVLIVDAIETAAIEGESLDRASVRSSVALQLGIDLPGGAHPSNASIDGLVQVLLDAAENYDSDLTEERIFGWHAALFPTGFSSLRQIDVGQLRGSGPMRVVSGRLGSERVHFEAPDTANLAPSFAQFLKWFNATRVSKGVGPELDGLIRAALSHLWFVTLHPFDDGNGRLARAVTDLALAQDEQRSVRLYSLSAAIMHERSDYYSILEKTQRGGIDVTPWIVWFLSCFERAIDRSQRVVDRVLEKARFWQRHAQKPISERQIKALNRLLDSGPGEFEGGMNTRKYVSLTRCSTATASRELADLVAKGCLMPLPGKGRSSSYEIRLVD